MSHTFFIAFSYALTALVMTGLILRAIIDHRIQVRALADLEARGIYVRSTSWAGLAEEAGGAYKDIDEVIAATELAGISKPVARFTPIGNVKG